MASSELARLRPGFRAAAGLALLLTALPWAAAPAAVPRVVTSIAPVHALTAAVMGDLGKPVQIVRGYGSPHAYQMRPSDAANLRDADLVLWIGPSLETFLQRPLQSRAGASRVLRLAALDGLVRLANRRGGVLAGNAHEHGHAAGHGFDAHIWLSPYNAKLMASAIAEELSRLDPTNAPAYQRNAQRFSDGIDTLTVEIRTRLTPVRSVPFVVFHDAFQYFEHSFGLNAVGSVTVSPDRMPSAKRITELKTAIDQSGARCVFREPGFESPLMQILTEDQDIRTGVLDPLGAQLNAGPDAYFRLMRWNTDALVRCLGP